jgi:predicted dinucleotide-binding enzyme
MRVGIIGSGDVGKPLGKGFIASGHQVKIGSRTPEKLNDWAKSAGASTGTFEEVARFGEVIALATLGVATEEALRLAGQKSFDGKVVLDATNPLKYEPGKPPTLAIAGNDAEAKKIVSKICSDFGWGVIDTGGIEGSRYLEGMCMTWVLHGALGVVEPRVQDVA